MQRFIKYTNAFQRYDQKTIFLVSVQEEPKSEASGTEKRGIGTEKRGIGSERVAFGSASILGSKMP